MNEERHYNRETQWHLDKRVPIMLIAALLLQSASIAWWASDINSRVAAHQATLEEFSDYRARVVRLETYQESSLRELRGIRSDLRQLLRERRIDDRGGGQ